MKLTSQKATLLQQEAGEVGIYKAIERAARVCYKSEDKITDDSYKSMMKLLEDNKHNAMLEHGTVYLNVPCNAGTILAFKSPYVKYHINEGRLYVTTNYRWMKETTDSYGNRWDDYKFNICEPTQYHYRRYSFHLITSIGIVRELLRHRKFSFANESTRYCNYNKDKFDNQITFIEPHWISDDREFKSSEAYDNAYELFCSACEEAEGYYQMMIEEGFTPQQAREFLPLCTKSEIIMTGFEQDWLDFIDKRLFETTGKVHPDMKALAKMIYDQTIPF